MGLAVSARTMIDIARSITKTETLDEANAFCTDAELLAVLNTELAELEDTVIENQDESYSRGVETIALQAGTSVYPLPVEGYKVTSVDIQWTNDIRRSAYRFTEAERNRFRSTIAQSWSHFGKVWYRLIGDNIEFIPKPATPVTALINYTPSFAPLVAYADVYQSQNGWHMAAVFGLAAYIALADSDEAKAALFLQQKERQLARAARMAASRIDGEAPRVQRTRGVGWEEDD